MSSSLFSSLQLGPYKLSNRIVMAPMTRNRAGPGGVPTPLNAVYYGQRASAGLIVAEASPVSLQAVSYPGMPGIHSEEQVAGWRRVTETVHAEGGLIFLQLFHGGRTSHPSHQPGGAQPVAPSAIRPEGNAMTASFTLEPFVVPRALATEELPGIIEQYRQGAVKAKKAGFDGVEIHAANGYLIDQFLRDGTNRREDRYGGSAENRSRFLLEIVEAVAGVFGAERVGVRLSPLNPFNDMRDSDPLATFRYVAEQLAPRRIAYLHVYQAGDDGRFDWNALRRAFGGPFIVNGGYDRARAEAAIETDTADLIAFGIPFLANPDLVERLRKVSGLNAPDPATFYGGDYHGYTDYPTMQAP